MFWTTWDRGDIYKDEHVVLKVSLIPQAGFFKDRQIHILLSTDKRLQNVTCRDLSCARLLPTFGLCRLKITKGNPLHNFCEVAFVEIKFSYCVR